MTNKTLIAACSGISVFHIAIIMFTFWYFGAFAGNQHDAKSCDMLIYRNKKGDIKMKHMRNVRVVRRHSDFQRHKTKLLSPKKVQAGKQLRWL